MKKKSFLLILLLHTSVQFVFSNPGYSAGVSTSSSEATQAAMAILKAGGSAVDAACGAVFVLNVTQPHFAGIGGGGFALISQNGKPSFLDFREEAGASVTSALFDSNGITEADWAVRNTG